MRDHGLVIRVDFICNFDRTVDDSRWWRRLRTDQLTPNWRGHGEKGGKERKEGWKERVMMADEWNWQGEVWVMSQNHTTSWFFHHSHMHLWYCHIIWNHYDHDSTKTPLGAPSFPSNFFLGRSQFLTYSIETMLWYVPLQYQYNSTLG